MAQYLITGIAGFIGSGLAHALVKRGEKVRGLDDFSTGRRENLDEIADKIDVRTASLLDPKALASACKGVDFVLHEAALGSVPRSVAEPGLTNRVNVEGTLNVLVAARDAKVKRVIYAASSSAYGDTPTLPKHEGMLPLPLSPYAVSKLAGEGYMQAFSRTYGLQTVSLRYFNVFGPRQDPTSQYSAVLARFIQRMLEGRQSVIFGDGEQSRDFTYIDNVVSANLLACAAPGPDVSGKVFNIACGEHYTLHETFRILQQIIGYKGEPQYDMPRSGDVRHSLADITLAEKDLGYKPAVDFQTGLEKTVAWYRAQMGHSAAAPTRH